MRAFSGWLPVLLVLTYSPLSWGDDIYVNSSNLLNPQTGVDCAHGYQKLQTGIDKAKGGDRVIVCVATYGETVKIDGKKGLTIISEPHATGVIPSVCPPICRGLPILTLLFRRTLRETKLWAFSRTV